MSRVASYLVGGGSHLFMEEVTTSIPSQYFTEIAKLLDQLDTRPREAQSPRGLAGRGALGDFISIAWFQGMLRGIEDVLGEQAAGVVVTRAGRLRGHALVDDWGVGHLNLPIEKLKYLLDAALGQSGTRLCLVKEIEERGEQIIVTVAETIGTSGPLPLDYSNSAYTLGAMWGALESLTGEVYKAEQWPFPAQEGRTTEKSSTEKDPAQKSPVSYERFSFTRLS